MKDNPMLNENESTESTFGENSQVANAEFHLNMAPLLPSFEELRVPGKVTSLIESAGEMRRGISNRSHKSLCHELAMCVHAALFIVIHQEWKNFCEWSERKTTEMPDDVDVLYAVLLHYTGSDTDGRKKASRYKRALGSLFQGRMPAIKVYEKLTKGGVDGLLKISDGGTRKIRTKSSTMNLVTISKPGTWRAALPAGASQKLIIAPEQGGRYQITVTNLGGNPRKPTKLHLKRER